MVLAIDQSAGGSGKSDGSSHREGHREIKKLGLFNRGLRGGVRLQRISGANFPVGLNILKRMT